MHIIHPHSRIHIATVVILLFSCFILSIIILLIFLSQKYLAQNGYTIRILPKRRNRLRNRPNPPSKQKRRYPFTCFRTAAFTPIRQEDAENARQNHSFGAVRSALPCVIPILAKALPTVITTSIFRGSRPSLSFRATYNLFGLSDGTTISYHSFSNFINPKSSP